MAAISRRVSLRNVTDDDVAIFFEHQSDPVAMEMAAIPSRNREDHLAHWEKTRSDESITMRTIRFDGDVAGHIVTWEEDGRHNVGYQLADRCGDKGSPRQPSSSFSK